MASIRLPVRPLLDPHVIAESIVDATYPAFENLQGIDCILGVQTRMGDHYFPMAISDAQRKEIVRLLPQLPPLHGRMFDSEVQNFLNEFKKLSSQASWLPNVVTEYARISRKQQREHFQREYFLDLKSSVNESKLIAVDEGHIRCKVLSIGAYIPYKEAVRYLEDSGHVVETNESEEGLALSTKNNRSSRHSLVSASTASTQGLNEPLAQSQTNRHPGTLGADFSDTKKLPLEQANIELNAAIISNKEAKVVNPKNEIEDLKHFTTAVHDLSDDEKHIELPALCELIGFKKTIIYAMMNEESPRYDPSFPKILPKDKGSSASRWSRQDVQAWMSRKKSKKR